MKKTLEHSRPVLIMELNRPALGRYGKDSQDIWKFFETIDYSIMGLTWSDQEPRTIKSIAELNHLCPPDGLIDIIAKS
jgi:hypothetical protein